MQYLFHQSLWQNPCYNYVTSATSQDVYLHSSQPIARTHHRPMTYQIAEPLTLDIGATSVISNAPEPTANATMTDVDGIPLR